MKLYHYTTFETFVYRILPKMQLKFFPFSSSNDPFEFSRLFRTYISKFSLHHHNEIVEEYNRQLNKYKFICFSKDKGDIQGFKLPTMWAHYGEKHNGVCLEIDIDKLDFSIFNESIIKASVIYDVPDPKDLVLFGSPKQSENAQEFIRRSISEHIKDWESTNLFTKLNDWEIENEYRIVYTNDDNDEHYLDINNALTNVYLGIRASQNWLESVKLRILEHQIDETNKMIGREIQIKFLENEGSLINSYELKLRRTIYENNSESSKKMELRTQGNSFTPS